MGRKLKKETKEIRSRAKKTLTKMKKAPTLYRCPNNNLFIAALIALVLFLLVELSLRIYELYRIAPLVDIPSHFFAGIALATGIYWILSLTKIKRKKFTALFYTLVGAIIWEVLETLEEMVFYNPEYLKDYFFWDGFFDIIVTLIGGIFATYLIYFLKTNTEIFDDAAL